MKVYVGTSGWQYKHWNKKFFPADLPKKEWLPYLASKFLTVEVNTTFYHLARASTFTKWKNETPGDFVFAIKLLHVFTHFRRLKLTKDDLDLLKTYVVNAKKLGTKLGPILVQLPPSLGIDLKSLEILLRKLKKQRVAVEFRHESWFRAETYDLLKKYNAAMVITSSPHWHSELRKTAAWVYVRFHGETKLFASNYRHVELKKWARRILDLKPKEIFCYFNNDANAYAAENAMFLKNLLEKNV
jgi:uncharacterized protein YecE (DUF72 family)